LHLSLLTEKMDMAIWREKQNTEIRSHLSHTT